MSKRGQMGVIGGLVGTIVLIVIIFASMRIGVFTDSTLDDAIIRNSGSYTTEQNETIEEIRDNQATSYTIIGVVVIIALIALIILVLKSLA